MVHMGGESWCTTKNLQAPFPDLKARYVDHLLSYIITNDYLLEYFSRKLYEMYIVNCIFQDNKVYFSKSMRLTNYF